MREPDAFAELAVVLMVNTTAAELPPGVTLFGVKLQSETIGAPEQEKLTVLLKDAPTGSTLKL